MGIGGSFLRRECMGFGRMGCRRKGDGGAGAGRGRGRGRVRGITAV